MGRWFQNHTVLLNQHSKHTLVKKLANLKYRPWLSRIPTTVTLALAQYWEWPRQKVKYFMAVKKCASEVVLLTITPKHCCIMATSCHVAQCIRRMPQDKFPLLRGNLRKTSLESLRITALVWKRLFFNSQGSCCLYHRPFLLVFSGCFQWARRALLRAETAFVWLVY